MTGNATAKRYGPRGTPRLFAKLSTLALCAALFCSGAQAQAGRNVAGAADAFGKAQQAELRGEFQEAAGLYALADEMAPAAEALRSAARTAQKAGMNATAATHAAALMAREPDATSRALAEEILKATSPELTRLHVTCDVACRVLIDGRMTASRLALDHVLYARPGDRAVSASFESGNAPAQTRTLAAASSAEFRFGAPVVAPVVAKAETSAPVEKEGRQKLSIWYFGTAGALTLVAGGLTTWSAVKVQSAHDKYDRSSPDAQQDYDDGRKLEKQTNALIGVTGGLLATTVALAFFTDFKGKDNSGERAPGTSVAVNATRQGAWLGLTGSF